jgi:soluble lytic murein transglycosylase-like protein
VTALILPCAILLALLLAGSIPGLGPVCALAAEPAPGTEAAGDAEPTPVDAAAPPIEEDGETDASLREQVDTLTAEIEALRGLVTDLAAQVARTRPALHSYRVPESMAFAGEAVPLDRWDVAERLEREFYLALAQPASVIFWLKRSARYFPYIEERLRVAGLPEDLKYVAVVESALQPRAYSWAHASGIWQFIADTGRRYRLRVTKAWDERRDPERSTAAAIAYLTDLHRRFDDWPLALAAYNAGEGRVSAAMKDQGVTEYYRLALPLETERYLFRILAAKLILEDPGQHGFEVPPEERYAPHPTDTVPVRVVGRLRVQELAAAAGSFYREIRALNPAIMGDVLPEGVYEVRIPQGLGARLTAGLPDLDRAMAARRVRRIEYRVKRGDTLVGIARRYGVSVGSLTRANPAARTRLHPGDRLVIDRPR